MIFKKADSNEVKSVTMPAIGVFIIGPLYFLFIGLIVPGLVLLVVNVAAAYLFGMIGPVVGNIIAAFFAGNLVRSHYSSRGWIEQTEGFVEDTAPTTRACPFCSEMILNAAVKCKHCGSAVEAVTVTDPYAADQPVQLMSPTGAPRAIHIERVMTAHNVKKSGEQYLWNGATFNSFDELAAGINKSLAEAA